MKNVYPSVTKIVLVLFIFSGILNAQEFSFSNATDIADNLFPVAIVSADFNDDNLPDLAELVRDFNIGHHVAIFLNKGNGDFNSVSDGSYLLGNSPTDLAVGDLNNDGYPDLISTVLNDTTLVFWFGQVDGTFINQQTMKMPFKVKYVNVADFNKDDNMDLVVVENGRMLVLDGNGDGSFQDPIEYNTSSNPWEIEVADLNKDGYMDILVSNGGGGYFIIHFNDKAGSFEDNIVISTPRPPWYISVKDFNADGYLDIAAGSGSYDFDNVFVLINDKEGNYTTTGLSSPCGYVRYADAADFNNDWKNDIVVIDDHGIYGLAGDGEGDFSFIDSIVYDPGALNAKVFLTTDINGDEKIDLIVGRSDRISIYYNTSTVSSVSDIRDKPHTLSLSQNYPNPFTAFTEICFDVGTANWVDLRIFDMNGKQISIISNEWLNEGEYCKSFDATGLSPGIYFYRISTKYDMSIQRMTVIR